MCTEREKSVGKERRLILCSDMLQYIKRENRVIVPRHRSREEVVCQNVETPTSCHALLNVFDKNFVEVCCRQPFYCLLYEARTKGVAASDLENILPLGEHLGDELVSR